MSDALATTRDGTQITIDPEFRDLIQPPTATERELLETSIASEGCRDPLVVWNGVLLDGHNRHEICTRIGKPYEVVELDLPDRAAAEEWIIRNQFGRRNLPSFVRIELALRLKPRIAAAAKARQHSTLKQNADDRSAEFGGTEGDTRDEVARLAEVGHDTLDRAEYLIENAPVQTLTLLRRGETTVNREYVALKKAERKAQTQDDLRNQPFPDGKYRVIYADPPWQYATEQHSHEQQETVLASHYPSMSLDSICELPVKDLATDDAVLFLWTTSPKLFEAKAVIDAWGFNYKASIVWDKVKHNVGYYVSVRHEFLLIATRGSCLPDVPKLRDSVVTIERTEHSVKPEYFREWIDQLYPTGPRIELFARESTEGWDVWGNQL